MKTTINLKIGSACTFSEISSVCGVSDANEIRSLLTEQLHSHHKFFGVEPFDIEYSRAQQDYIIRANSIIGIIDCKRFVLSISPKFTNLEIGKCLQLAHYSNAIDLVHHNSSVTDNLVSDNTKLAAFDYFALTFCSAVQDCINNGLLTEQSQFRSKQRELKGKLVLGKHIANGGNPLEPYVSRNIRTHQCAANSILKTTLTECAKRITNGELRSLANNLIPIFSDCKEIQEIQDSDFDSIVTTIPRADYDHALSLSKVILNGFDPLTGSETGFTPFYSLDLDQVFERYCAHELSILLSKNHFKILSQKGFAHRFEPTLASKKIFPDVILQPISPNGRSVVIDTKNKFSLSSNQEVSISNNDIYQIKYYAESIPTNVGVLLYPGDDANCSRYPIRSSEGEEAYEKKLAKRQGELLSSGTDIFRLRQNNNDFYLIIWRVNLSGTLYDTRSSLAEFCQLLSDISERKFLD